MANLAVPFAVFWLITLAGGLVVLGALGALTNDSEVSPLFAPYRPFRNWRGTIAFFYASVTGFLIPLTNDVFVAKGALPGSNGSDSRANAAAAGLILVFIGNYVQAILAALHDTDEPKAQTAEVAGGKDLA
ncbi:glycogen-branching enzyme [Chlorella sorokiniana]|uniref:Glycogen-branching enzyme n=1 Tax=Chlorella sorokiniana TaxID=3076 RepID=A0A2P6TNH6_CHLSO|nr:glycogen-branching enzyme [Chlorella sorokiniana]|eukprot:PRW50869.1 glycogen-branching enzyme [Chlorella sorokiniana]